MSRGLCAIAAVVALNAMAARPFLAINEDNDRYIIHAKGEGLTERGIRDYFDSVAAGGAVTHFFMCVSGQRTSYDSKVWEPIWLGCADKDERGRTNVPWCVNAKLLADRGIDPWRIWSARAREKGISPWISMRMNDAHYANYPYKVHRNEQFWWDHDAWWCTPGTRGKKEGVNAFDFARPEVREHAMALVREILGRWDMDGFEADWMRQYRCLAPGKERENAHFITEVMREIRRAADAASVRLGHRVDVSVRLPSTLAAAKAWGFDPDVWAKEGLVQLIVPCCHYSIPDYAVDLAEWRRAVAGAPSPVRVVPGMDVMIGSGGTKVFPVWRDVALVRGWMANMAAAGSDGGAYFFNAPYWREAERRALYRGDLSSERAVRERRRFPVTYHEAAPKGLSDIQLSVSEKEARVFRVQAAKTPDDLAPVSVVIGFNRADVTPPAIALNGVAPMGDAVKTDPEGFVPGSVYARCAWTWKFPASAMKTGVNEVSLPARAERPSMVVWVELAVEAPGVSPDSACPETSSHPAENPNRIRPLADDFVVVCRSPDPKTVYCYTPGICRLDSGRLVATCDLGGKGVGKDEMRGRIFLSDDHGRTWRETGRFPMCHARPFVAGGKIYILGHSGNLGVLCSSDGGETWGETSWLTEGQHWHQSACNVWYAKGNVYLVMERNIPSLDGRKFGWSVNRLAPVLMRAKESSDLTKRGSWTFAESFCFDSIFGGNPDPELDYVGIPWYTAFTAFQTKTAKGWQGKVPAGTARSQPIGWLETNVVQLQDPNHVWHDPSGSTFHLFMRANTGGAGYAALAKVVEQEDGTMKTMLECAPSGRKMLFVPFPGGQMRFHVLWDEQTRLYWLLSTQATDTMVRHDRLPKGRYNLPYDERQRMQLSFSKNMYDWCFAGIVAIGGSIPESRHYASMAFDGEDLVIVSRSGTPAAANPHNGDMITFHRVRNFRSLVY